MELPFIDLGRYLLTQADAMFTFSLLLIRFVTLFTFLPGLSASKTGMMVRYAGVFSMVFASFGASAIVPVPENLGLLTGMFVGEAALGAALGLIPFLLVSGVQMAGTLSATTMGLGAGQLIDPTSGTSVTAIARLFGDLVIIMFLFMDGHHVLIYAASGMDGALQPGSFWIGEVSLTFLLDRFGEVFRIGAMVSAPVIVALMLTNFVMGLVTKAIPQVNIFIVSFPLTIGIGLVITALSLEEMLMLMSKKISDIEPSVLVILQDVARVGGN